LVIPIQDSNSYSIQFDSFPDYLVCLLVAPHYGPCVIELILYNPVDGGIIKTIWNNEVSLIMWQHYFGQVRLH